MKALADRIMDILPETPHGLSLRAAVSALRQDVTLVRAAFERLATSGCAVIVRRGQGGALFLVHPRVKVLACKVCHHEFQRGAKSKRVTCSKKCAISLGWTSDQERAAKRRLALSRAQSTPKALARTAAHNKRRWSDPAEHENLAAQNRREWNDPEKSAVRAAKIRLNHGKPEVRKFYSDLRKEDWANPEQRKKIVAGIKRSKNTPEAKAKFSKLLSDRWKDPVMREKYTKANANRNSPELRAQNSARMKALWADTSFKEKMSVAIRESRRTP